MPNLLDRITDFAQRNLPPPPGLAQVPPAEPKIPKAANKRKPTPGPVPQAGTELARFIQFMSAAVGGKYCSPPRPALYKKPGCSDCSGTVAWAYYQATGRPIPGNGDSHEQYNLAGRFLKRPKGGKPGEAWLPGDLLFYRPPENGNEYRSGNYASHVAMYLGDGKAISALNPGAGVVIHSTTSSYWNKCFLNAKRLWEAEPSGGEIPTGPVTPPVTPDGAKPVTQDARPIEPVASVPVTNHTPFRAVPPLTVADVLKFLTDANSPMAVEAEGIFNACGPLVLLALAQSFKESQYGKAAGAPYNPLGLMELDGSTLMSFNSWSAAFAEWWRRMTDSGYKRGVYMPRDMTLEQYLVTYVGGPGCWSSRGETCGNGETWTPGGGPESGSINMYDIQTIARMNRMKGTYQPDPLWPDYGDPTDPNQPTPTGWKAWRVEGSQERLWLPDDIQFEIQLTPAWRTCNRSGRRLNWTGIRQHETGNTRVGAGARMHANWQYNGTEGHPDGCVAVHFYVENKLVIQTLPVNEQGIHSGDAGNQTQVAIEACVNADANWNTTKDTTARLEAGLQFLAGFTPEADMWMHHEGSGCPPNLRAVWPAFERQVRQYLNAIVAAV